MIILRGYEDLLYIEPGTVSLATIESTGRFVLLDASTINNPYDFQKYTNTFLQGVPGVWIKQDPPTKNGRLVAEMDLESKPATHVAAAPEPLNIPKIAINRSNAESTANEATEDGPLMKWVSIVEGRDGEATRKLVINYSLLDAVKSAFYEAANGYATVFTCAVWHAEPIPWPRKDLLLVKASSQREAGLIKDEENMVGIWF